MDRSHPQLRAHCGLVGLRLPVETFGHGEHHLSSNLIFFFFSPPSRHAELQPHPPHLYTRPHRPPRTHPSITMAKGGGRLVQAQKAAKKQQHQPPNKKQKTTALQTNGKPKPNGKPKGKPVPPPKSHLAPTIPFSPHHHILLVGEGDLSFAASLATHHACTHLTATVYEPSEAAFLEKYPHAAAHITTLSAAPGAKLLFGIDARRMAPFLKSKHSDTGAMDRILFNFPHVGGKSTDVNRQVRHNQELLVEFFQRAIPSLAPRGKVVVTLFEGEPYTLWNVRDLARHAGLAVERSFRFRAEAYPGYRHARTLGVVRRRDGEESTSGWRGEERAAKSYVFVRKEDAPAPGKRKRKGESSGSESEESEGEGEGTWSEEEGEGEEGEDEEGGDGDEGRGEQEKGDDGREGVEDDTSKADDD
ncbi:hypothetical protein B0T16DRAFT_429142 [Cercophora newfieldiana]|uniref:25S rRNA (uridine-N(3))-methyltransferase BMT5-like domain-containing protein n=1 Tax=Cercophora newfieldiana TaxID=92897 RepID=A0AA39Y5V6_9PEZI|nr:hypothetical protein B0T16DRAFT_429142 [Cercophora newfieldiana]